MQTPPSFLSNLSTPSAAEGLKSPISLTTTTKQQHQQQEEELEEQRLRNSPQFITCSDENAMPTLSNMYSRNTSSPFVTTSRGSRRSKHQKTRIGISNSSFDDMLSFATPLSPAPPHCGFDVFTSPFGPCEHIPGPHQSFNEVNTSHCALRNTSYNNSFINSNNISHVNDLGSGGINMKSGEDSVEVSCPLANDSHLYSKKEEGVGSVSQSVGSEYQGAIHKCNTSLFKSFGKSLGLISSLSHRISHVMTTVAHTTVGGQRNSQEDAVCIHERVPFPTECSLSQKEKDHHHHHHHTNSGKVHLYNMYGVFDGHNGDRLSNLASLYYLEHFNEALTRSAWQYPSIDNAEEGYTSESATIFNRREEGGTSSVTNTNSNSGMKVSGKSVGELPITEETILPPQRFVSNALVQSLIHLDRTLYDTARETQKRCVGTTAGIVACYEGTSPTQSGCIPSYISIANLGDSRAVLARTSDGSVLISTLDHRIATHPWEKTRVAQCGGCIECDRVDGALQVTRSLGDYIYKLPPEQWVSQAEIEEKKKKKEDSRSEMMSSAFGSSMLEWMNTTVPQVDITVPLCEDNLMKSNEDLTDHLSPVFQSFSQIGVTTATTTSNSNNNNNNNDNDSDSCGKRLRYCSISATPHRDSVAPLIQLEDSEAEPCLTSNIVSNIADVYEAELKGDEFLVLATDGLWDHMSTEEVVDFVRTRLLHSGILSGNRPLQSQQQQQQQEKEKEEEEKEEEEEEEENENEKEQEQMDESVELLVLSTGCSQQLPAFTYCDTLKAPQDGRQTPPPPTPPPLPPPLLSISSSHDCPHFSSSALLHVRYNGSDDVGGESQGTDRRFSTPPPQCMLSRREDRMNLNSFRFAMNENNNNNNNNNNSDAHKMSPGTPTNSEASTQYCGNSLRHVLQEIANSLADHVVHDLHSGDNVTIVLLVFHSSDEYQGGSIR
ncbi:uncharacterized protein TM35_000361830 [Trypanosoma theileri]|uniref:protein-serine/threonine phosphatase n=1 Tax=Trypanosoma theileri TaxID=67003 RepID=A0A1X0NLI8_9TRYP|nr:uncharacterized protein TM35_000361830 [Trypanosoma theileri]ORC85323.1 hypothetical protein TM35_000361830 [Trypanosoma theileri]